MQVKYITKTTTLECFLVTITAVFHQNLVQGTSEDSLPWNCTRVATLPPGHGLRLHNSGQRSLQHNKNT